MVSGHEARALGASCHRRKALNSSPGSDGVVVLSTRASVLVLYQVVHDVVRMFRGRSLDHICAFEQICACICSYFIDESIMIIDHASAISNQNKIATIAAG